MQAYIFTIMHVRSLIDYIQFGKPGCIKFLVKGITVLKPVRKHICSIHFVKCLSNRIPQ